VERLSWLQVFIVFSILFWNMVEVFSIYKLLNKHISQSILVKRLVVVINIVYWRPLGAVEKYIVDTIPYTVLKSIGIISNIIALYIIDIHLYIHTSTMRHRPTSNLGNTMNSTMSIQILNLLLTICTTMSPTVISNVLV